MSQLKRIAQKTKKTCLIFCPKSHSVFESFCWQKRVLLMCKCTVSTFFFAGPLILRHKLGSVRIWGCSSCDFDIGPCCEQKFQDPGPVHCEGELAIGRCFFPKHDSESDGVTSWHPWLRILNFCRVGRLFGADPSKRRHSAFDIW